MPGVQVVLAVLCAPFAGDSNNTLLHYLAAGAPLGAVGRLLWVASGGPHSQEVSAAGQGLACMWWALLAAMPAPGVLCAADAAHIAFHCLRRRHAIHCAWPHWALQVQPGRNDERRAQLAEWLLNQYSAVLRLLCARNAAGLTPLHSCLGSASAETLRVSIVSSVGASGCRVPLGRVRPVPKPAGCTVGRSRLALTTRMPLPPRLQALVRGAAPLSPATRRLLLAVPFPGGQSPLDVCLQDPRHWEAVVLLVAAGSHLLGHGFLAAAHQVAVLLGSPLAAGGGFGAKGAGSGGLVQAVSGVLRSAIGSLLDRVAGQAPQREAVEQHLAARQAQRVSAAGSSSAGAAGADGSAGPSGVAVLAGAVEVERLRQEQIDSVARILGVSAPEAAALLAAHGYDEVRVMQARLGAGGGGPAGEASAESGSGGGGVPNSPNGSRAKAVGLAAVLEPAGEGTPDSAGSGSCSGRAGPGIIDAIAWQASGGSAPAAAVLQQPSPRPPQQCLVCYEACSSNSAMPCGHPTCDACWTGILRAQLDTGERQATRGCERGVSTPVTIASCFGCVSRLKMMGRLLRLRLSYLPPCRRGAPGGVPRAGLRDAAAAGGGGAAAGAAGAPALPAARGAQLCGRQPQTALVRGRRAWGAANAPAAAHAACMHIESWVRLPLLLQVPTPRVRQRGAAAGASGGGRGPPLAVRGCRGRKGCGGRVPVRPCILLGLR